MTVPLGGARKSSAVSRQSHERRSAVVRHFAVSGHQMPRENEITDWFLELLRGLSPRLVARGLRQGLGVLGTPTSEPWEVRGRTEYAGLDGAGGEKVPTVLVGLNSDGR